MAAISVKEHFKTRPTDEKDGVRRHQRGFYVQTNLITDTGPIVTAAAGIPSRFSPHPHDPGTLAINIHADKLGDSGYAWDVRVEYSSELPTKLQRFMETAVPSGTQVSPQAQNNPLLLPPRVDWDVVKYEEAISYDMDGNLIVNTADLGFSPSPTKVVSGLVLRVVRNEIWFDPHIATDYMDSTNTDVFWDYEAGLCKCDKLIGGYKHENNQWFAEVNYEIHVRDFVRVRLRGQSTDTLFYPWKLNVLNAGFFEKIGVNVDGSNKYREIRAGGGSTISEPHPLAENGTKLLPTATPFFKVFRTCKEKAFAPLGLPDPYA